MVSQPLLRAVIAAAARRLRPPGRLRSMFAPTFPEAGKAHPGGRVRTTLRTTCAMQMDLLAWVGTFHGERLLTGQSMESHQLMRAVLAGAALRICPRQ